MNSRRRTPRTAAVDVLVGVAIVNGLVGCAAGPGITSRSLNDQTTNANLPRVADGRSAELLSAFFGLDNALPRRANLICRGAGGRDGMPVIFSEEIDPMTVDAGDFEVIAASGRTGEMHCVSFMPATDQGELRTVLLIGEFGDAEAGPPARVRMIGNVHSLDGVLNFRGAEADVTPLTPGPTIVLAEQVTDFDQSLSMSTDRTRGSVCPATGVKQAVRVVWAGGVTLPGGDEPAQDVGAMYRVSVRLAGGAVREVKPVYLADLGDGDNNHLLCLDTEDEPLSVSFPAGVLTDPNEDLNPATAADVVTAKR